MHSPLLYMRRSFFVSGRKTRSGPIVTCIIALVVLLAGCGAPVTMSAPTGSSVAATATPRPSLVFAAIGASETFGTGADNPARENWPTDLQPRLPSGAQVINLGIPGITAQEALQGELPEALDARPDIASVWLGTNDVIQNVPLADYKQYLDTILTQLEAIPHIHIVVANLADLTLLPRFANDDQNDLRQIDSQWNAAIQQEITAHHALLVDIYSHTSELTSHPEYLSADGLHPSTEGYLQIANLFYQVLHDNGVI